MEFVNGRLIWMLFLSDIFHTIVPIVSANVGCGQIQIVRPAFVGRNVTLKFIPGHAQHDANVNWKRRRGTNPWSDFTKHSRFFDYEKNGVYYVTIKKAKSRNDAIDYMVDYDFGDRNVCTSDIKTLTLKNLDGCGYLYRRSSNIIINKTVEIGYYPTMDIIKKQDEYVRYWYRNNECRKGCLADQTNNKLEERPYPNHEFVLKINHLDKTDGGIYKLQCTRGRQKNRFTNQVNISLPVPPSSPTLAPLDTVDGCTDCIVGREDTEIEVLCESFGGTQPINVTIEVADTRLNAESDKSGEYRASLRLYDTSHHMAKLVCSVANYGTAVPLTTETYIYVIKTSTTPTVYIPNRLVEGDQVNITCAVTNTRPAPTNITLLIDGSVVDGLVIRHDLDKSTRLYNSLVTLTKFKRTWSRKNLTCCVNNYGVQRMCSFPQQVDLIYERSSVKRSLPIELIGGVGGATALMILGTCLAVIGACKHRKTTENDTGNDDEIIEYDKRRQDSPSINEEVNGPDLVYLELNFDGNTVSSNQPVRKQCDSSVDYVAIDFVKTIQSAKENVCKDDEENIYINS